MLGRHLAGTYPPWNSQFAPENQWLEDVFPFRMGYFQRRTVSLKECNKQLFWMNHLSPASYLQLHPIPCFFWGQLPTRQHSDGWTRWGSWVKRGFLCWIWYSRGIGRESLGIPHHLHPGRLTWNLKMIVWKMIFLFNWVIFRFHVDLPGCRNWNVVSSWFVRLSTATIVVSSHGRPTEIIPSPQKLR